ncbi:ATPase [Stigmatella sp. ncwal1]|uniref:ATPase n=1 Tax=Stigmatella ashevillensis TaxID=2995309 RepID=A0ABT5DH91_9BACT|nr:ATPase [Stigmatella ashevillena]MDC0713035.1 ATPase [Stigmatella ashevillena]
MAEKWDKQFMDFIRRTSEDIRRTGEDLKIEAERLLVEVRDPARQAKLKATLTDFRDKAAAVTKEAAERLEGAARHVEDFVSRGLDNEKPAANTAKAPSSAPAEASAKDTPAAKAPRKTGKTIGKKTAVKKAPAAKKASSAKKAAASKTAKTLGRKGA